ncbi:MAG TPA: TIGR04282 family arsenosugar biosynthesis glycosyltransferase [Ktedonobacteraceae bacterium]|jgi:rSAM/selenodomain-associated transferase 1|nr:TIGR04282 family arsenosugar biosynthesis glycosyltransferase [Ktedonobacteraceae bacterium]
MPDTTLVIMARYPHASTTKTRLARSIGDEAVIKLYKAFLTDLACKFAGRVADLHWSYTPSEVNFAGFIASLTPSLAQRMHYFPQQGAGLGERLLHTFQFMHKSGYKRTIVIASDSPHMCGDIVATARQALDGADVVLGPADDGGYYLIAMRQPHDVFRGIPMSTSKVARMTIELAQSQGLKVSTLETLFDVDELSDLERLEQLLGADSSLAPVTAALLSTGIHKGSTRYHKGMPLLRSLYDNSYRG